MQAKRRATFTRGPVPRPPRYEGGLLGMGRSSLRGRSGRQARREELDHAQVVRRRRHDHRLLIGLHPCNVLLGDEELVLDDAAGLGSTKGGHDNKNRPGVVCGRGKPGVGGLWAQREGEGMGTAPCATRESKQRLTPPRGFPVHLRRVYSTSFSEHHEAKNAARLSNDSSAVSTTCSAGTWYTQSAEESPTSVCTCDPSKHPERY